MCAVYILHNPSAGKKGEAERYLRELQEKLEGKDPILMDLTEKEDCGEFLAGLAEKDKIYLCGGDGTLNRFVNAIGDVPIRNDIYYCATGNGNDFLRDIGGHREIPVQINAYLENLPLVTVKGYTMRFINGVGYGIDGYCCEEGDRLKARGKMPNYTMIAIKGLLRYFRPVGAKITVDGISWRYKGVWLAPTMNGRFYGGGMIPTPNQDRLNCEGIVSLMLIHGAGRLKTLCCFPSLFKGEHLKYEKITSVHTGHDILVEFDRPCPLQVDGETFSNVTQYRVQGWKTAQGK